MSLSLQNWLTQVKNLLHNYWEVLYNSHFSGSQQFKYPESS